MLSFSVKNLFDYKQYMIVLAVFSCSCSALAQIKTHNQEIVLQNEQLIIKPAGFYIANVKDEREDKTAVARIVLPQPGKNTGTRTVAVDFRMGCITAITKFIGYSVPKNAAYQALNINLKKFEAVETPVANGQAEGHVALVFSFELVTDFEKVITLGTYNSNTVYQRTMGNAQDIEPTLRHMLQNGLIYINNWMLKQAGSNINLAKKVQVGFTDFTEKNENDTVYYSVNRPLTWDDFQSKAPITKYDALVFASIGYNEEVKVENSIINLQLNMKVFVPKSACWVKDGNRTEYALNHEQRHFDIAKIISERFKRRLKTEDLPVANYDGAINMDYLDAYREMDALQKQYDDETNHGANQSAQETWNLKIDSELKLFGVK